MRFLKFLPRTVVKLVKRSNELRKTIRDTCVINIRSYEIFELFFSYSCNKPLKRSIELSTRFVILVH